MDRKIIEGGITTAEMTNRLNGNFEELYSLTQTSSNAFKALAQLIYPVGCYYWSSNNTDPSSLFGGSWERIKDKFVLAAGDSYAIDTTGGEATHTLTIAEIPSHNHGLDVQGQLANTTTAIEQRYVWKNGTGSAVDNKIAATGGGEAHNNMPPYVTAYCWKRIA